MRKICFFKIGLNFDCPCIVDGAMASEEELYFTG